MKKRLEQLWEMIPWFGVMILATDLLFIGLNLVQLTSPYLQDVRFSIEREVAYAEVFQYLKEYWLACLFLFLFLKKRQHLFLVLSLAFGYILVDDWFQIHETLGAMLAAKLSLPAIGNLRPRDLGELTVLCGIGTILTTIFIVSYLQAGPLVRKVAHQTALFMAALVLFGVGIDLMHAATPPSSLKIVMGLLEDGGEMLMMSLMCWHAVGAVVAATAVPAIERNIGFTLENARIACNR